jgi:hypothetical protein
MPRIQSWVFFLILYNRAGALAAPVSPDRAFVGGDQRTVLGTDTVVRASPSDLSSVSADYPS